MEPHWRKYVKGRPRQEDEEFKIIISGCIYEFKDTLGYIYKPGKEDREVGREKKIFLNIYGKDLLIFEKEQTCIFAF